MSNILIIDDDCCIWYCVNSDRAFHHSMSCTNDIQRGNIRRSECPNGGKNNGFLVSLYRTHSDCCYADCNTAAVGCDDVAYHKEENKLSEMDGYLKSCRTHCSFHSFIAVTEWYRMGRYCGSI